MSSRRWRQRAAASLLRSRRRSLLRISSGVMSSVRTLLFGPGKRLVVFGCPVPGNCSADCCCQSSLLSSEKQSLLWVNSFSSELSVDSIFAIVVGVNTRDDNSVGITQPVCRYKQQEAQLPQRNSTSATHDYLGWSADLLMITLGDTMHRTQPVSYTHLTLPTILRV